MNCFTWLWSSEKLTSWILEHKSAGSVRQSQCAGSHSDQFWSNICILYDWLFLFFASSLCCSIGTSMHFPSVAPSPLLYLAMGIKMANGLRATQHHDKKIIQNHMEPQRLPCKAPAPGTEVASSNDGSNLGTSTKSTGFCCLGSNIPVDPHREQM